MTEGIEGAVVGLLGTAVLAGVAGAVIGKSLNSKPFKMKAHKHTHKSHKHKKGGYW
jgi:hypothetical protein